MRNEYDLRNNLQLSITSGDNSCAHGRNVNNIRQLFKSVDSMLTAIVNDPITVVTANNYYNTNHNYYLNGCDWLVVAALA